MIVALVGIVVSILGTIAIYNWEGTQEKPTQLPQLDKQYIELMRSYDNEYLDRVSDDALLGIAKNLCSDFMYGYNLDEVIAFRLYDSTEESRLVFGYVLLNGTKTFCPEYQDYVEELTW